MKKFQPSKEILKRFNKSMPKSRYFYIDNMLKRLQGFGVDVEGIVKSLKKYFPDLKVEVVSRDKLGHQNVAEVVDILQEMHISKKYSNEQSTVAHEFMHAMSANNKSIAKKAFNSWLARGGNMTKSFDSGYAHHSTSSNTSLSNVQAVEWLSDVYYDVQSQVYSQLMAIYSQTISLARLHDPITPFKAQRKHLGKVTEIEEELNALSYKQIKAKDEKIIAKYASYFSLLLIEELCEKFSYNPQKAHMAMSEIVGTSFSEGVTELLAILCTNNGQKIKVNTSGYGVNVACAQCVFHVLGADLFKQYFEGGFETLAHNFKVNTKAFYKLDADIEKATNLQLDLDERNQSLVSACKNIISLFEISMRRQIKNSDLKGIDLLGCLYKSYMSIARFLPIYHAGDETARYDCVNALEVSYMNCINYSLSLGKQMPVSTVSAEHIMAFMHNTQALSYIWHNLVDDDGKAIKLEHYLREHKKDAMNVDEFFIDDIMYFKKKNKINIGMPYSPDEYDQDEECEDEYLYMTDKELKRISELFEGCDIPITIKGMNGETITL